MLKRKKKSVAARRSNDKRVLFKAFKILAEDTTLVELKSNLEEEQYAKNTQRGAKGGI